MKKSKLSRLPAAPQKPNFLLYGLVALLYDCVCAGFCIWGILSGHGACFFIAGAFSAFAAEVHANYFHQLSEFTHYSACIGGLASNFFKAVANTSKSGNGSISTESAPEGGNAE